MMESGPWPPQEGSWWALMSLAQRSDCSFRKGPGNTGCCAPLLPPHPCPVLHTARSIPGMPAAFPIGRENPGFCHPSLVPLGPDPVSATKSQTQVSFPHPLPGSGPPPSPSENARGARERPRPALKPARSNLEAVTGLSLPICLGSWKANEGISRWNDKLFPNGAFEQRQSGIPEIPGASQLTLGG